jgi:hypothetical protein
MISKVECEILECDNCKELFEDSSGFTIFADENALKENAMDDGWEMNHESGKHYCDKCHSYGDDNDEFIIDSSRTKVDGDDSVAKDSAN